MVWNVRKHFVSQLTYIYCIYVTRASCPIYPREQIVCHMSHVPAISDSFNRSLCSIVHSSYISVTISYIWYATVVHNVFTIYIYIYIYIYAFYVFLPRWYCTSNSKYLFSVKTSNKGFSTVVYIIVADGCVTIAVLSSFYHRLLYPYNSIFLYWNFLTRQFGNYICFFHHMPSK